MKFVLTITFLSLFGLQQYEPKTGDLLFQDLDCGPLCDAIEAVTQGIDGAKFSHIGMVIQTDTGTYVYEAIGAGVVLTPLSEFLNRSLDAVGSPKVLAGRLSEEYSELTEKIKAEALNYLGQPYDTVYLMNNDAWYCSELLYQCFVDVSGDSNFFSIEPMTFKAPGDSAFFAAWEEYYSKMNTPIPQGKPGLNPAGISRSDKIQIVWQFGCPEGYRPCRSVDK